ncbi:MAG: chemotaxis protein CheB [Rhodanobacteraceae bacterium]|nr:chemotaxis protein CheB [Rhodanobacteraceae bacterium]
MPNSFDRDETVSVALLYQTSQLEGHLKEALKELGAAIVYEALTAQMDRDALEGSGAHVVIVNLDPEIESHLDEVYDLLDDERYNVVFNDAQVSSALSGWEQARWSRHLAAKIMGRPEVADPPRPAGAEAPPSPAQKIAKKLPDVPQQAPATNTFAPDAAATALFSSDAGLSDALDALFGQAAATPGPAAKVTIPAAAPVAAPPPAAPAAAADFGFDFDELLGSSATPAATPSSSAPTLELPQPPQVRRAAASDGFDFDFDLPSLSPSASAPATPPAADFDLSLDLGPEHSPPEVEKPEFDLDFDLGALNIPEPSVPVSRGAQARDVAADFGFSESDFGVEAFSAPSKVPTSDSSAAAESDADFSFGAEMDALFDTTSFDAPAPAAAAAELVDFDAAFSSPKSGSPADADLIANVPTARDAAPASPAPAQRKFEMPTDFSKWSLEPLTEDSSDAAPAAPAAPAKPEEFGVAKVSTESFLSGGAWSLEDMDEADGSESGNAKSTASAVKVEKVDAQQYLAPEGGDASKFDFDTSLKLDLMPMEEAVSPEREHGNAAVEHRLDGSAPAKPVRRVFVLGASIGGPEAVREFLSGLPARFPALFVLAQHMGAEFLELMAAQLAKATPLTVRAPGHGERVAHGEVVVVPTTHRMLIDAEGVVQLAHLPEASPYSPSIDLIVRDVADRFGAAATLIIFSGMAHDAIEGAKHLAAKGGQVWVQDPDTCVISSMVDGARDAGVVSFTGSPAELAKQTIAATRA